MAYGLRIINDKSELLIDSDYVNPTFIRKLEFNVTPSAGDELHQPNLHDGYTRRFYSTPTITMGVGNYIVLWTLPDSIVPDQPEKEVWYLFPTSVAEITSTSPVLNNLYFDCEVFASTVSGANSTTYSLPTAYIFAVDVAGLSSLTSTGPALRMYNSDTPQKKTFDSNFTQLVPYDISNNFALPTDTSPPNTPNSPTGTSLYLSTPTNPIYLLPKTAVAFASQRTVSDDYSQQTNYTDWAVFEVVFKRVGQYIESRTMRTANDSEQMSFTPLFATYFAGTYTNLSIIVADADLYQTSGAGTGGGAIPTYSLSRNVSSVSEGGSFTITLTTTNLANGTAIGYNVTGIQDLDLTAGLTTSNFIINNNTASVTFTVKNDSLTEGTETFRLEVTTGSYPYIDVSILDTSTATVSYSISPQTATVNEGSPITFTVNTTSVANGTVLYWSNQGGSSDPDTDFTVQSGTVTINNNTGTFSITPSADTTTEGSETFSVSVKTVSNTGEEVAYTSTITIADTSKTPLSYTITPAANSVDEDFSSLVISVGGTSITDGTYYWKINHVTTVAADFYANSGSFSIASDSGSFSITPQVDNITEGAQTFTVSILSDSTSGTVLKTSGSITVNDTSLWPAMGTLISASCLYGYGVSPYTLRQVRADGSGGTTISDATNSATCGWTQTYNETITASPSLVSLSSYTDLEIFYGEAEAAAYIVSTNNGDAQPALATFTNSTPFYLDTSGYYINTVLGSAISATPADKRLWVYFPYSGNYRSARLQVVLDAGTAVGNEYCGTGTNSTTLYQNYANGSGGSTASVVEYYSTSCGWVAPTATWIVQYSNSGTSGGINVTVSVSLTGVSPTAQTFYFTGYVSENSAGFDLPAVTVNAGSSSGSAVGASGFINGSAPYSTITLVASVETAPYTITPSTRSNSFLYNSGAGGGGGY